MRAVIQRVRRAEVAVSGETVGKIGHGLLVFVGIEKEDTPKDVEWLASRILKVRIFEDDDSMMNRSIQDLDGEILVISQFTLFGNMRKGNRPSFNRSAPPEQAIPLYESFVDALKEGLGRPVPTGRFQAMMDIIADNYGPVTLMLDSQNRDL